MSLKEKLMQLTQLNAVFFKKDAGAEGYRTDGGSRFKARRSYGDRLNA